MHRLEGHRLVSSHMTDPVPDLPDPAEFSREREVIGVYDYWDGEVVYCIGDPTARGRWVAVESGDERALEGVR